MKTGYWLFAFGRGGHLRNYRDWEVWQTTPEFARFVRIAMGPAIELDYHLLLSHDLGYLPVDEHRAFAGRINKSAQNARIIACNTGINT